ncbi:MAG: hypothetical protein KF752_11940 [Pirellulaceae bacterium]|nr:hypothetical protein [Pirellulaceae bacterium]
MLAREMISDTIQRDKSNYPGGKSGAGIFQRLINLIPRHRILIVPFAGHCGVVRNIKPAEHTIVIDQNASVCQWWADWSRTKREGVDVGTPRIVNEGIDVEKPKGQPTPVHHFYIASSLFLELWGLDESLLDASRRHIARFQGHEFILE